MRRLVHWVPLAAVVLLAGCFCITQLAEVDFHWHLLAGQRILAGQGPPRTDDLSFASAGRPWIDLQWLFELLIAATDRAFSGAGLDLLKIALICGALALAITTALRRSHPATVAVLGLLTVIASQERFALRPEAVSFLFLAALLALLEQPRRGLLRLAAIPLVIMLWANFHALYAVGLAALALTWLGETVDRVRSGRAARLDTAAPALRARGLGAALALSLPASLLTPYGFGSWRLPWTLFLERVGGRNLYGRHIAEFQAPFGGFGTTSAILAFGVLALIVVFACLISLRDGRLADRALLCAFLILALLARRNIPLFALVAITSGSAVVMEALRRLAGWLKPSQAPGSERFRRHQIGAAVVVTTLAALTAVDVVTNRFYARDAAHRYFGRGAAPGFYPEGGARLVAERGLSGQVLNDLTTGGYLAWRWFPARRIFIDGRLEVHDPGLFASYLALQRDPDAFETVARRDGIDAVLWSHTEASGAAPLLRYLASGHGWHLTSVDLASALFVRDGARTAAGEPWPIIDPDDPGVLARIRAEGREAVVRSARSDPLPRFIRGYLPRQEVPVAITNAAIALAISGGPRTAAALFQDAITVAPENAMLRYDLGMVLRQIGRDAEARRAFEFALERDPAFSAAHAGLGLMDLAAGDPDSALRRWHLAERMGSLEPAVLEARAALRARRGELDDAIDDYRAWLRIEPRRNEIRVLLGRLQAANGDPDGAERTLRRALSNEPTLARAHLGLAVVLASQGRLDASLEEAREAVRRGLDPRALSSEPALRVLGSRAEFQQLLGAAGTR